MSDFNFNEVVIDRVHRIHEYDLNGKRLWTMNQVKDFKLTLGGETVYAQDAQGVNIMAFDKSKTAEADWSNALMHLGALAEQMGSKKEVASSEAKQVFTTVEYLTSADGKKLTLTHTPKAAVANAPFKYIDLVDGQGNALKTFELGETAESQFSVTGTEVTLPTGANLKAGDRVYTFLDNSEEIEEEEETSYTLTQLAQPKTNHTYAYRVYGQRMYNNKKVVSAPSDYVTVDFSTGINKTEAAENAAEVARYTVDGVKVGANARGVVLVKYADGSVKKQVQ